MKKEVDYSVKMRNTTNVSEVFGGIKMRTAALGHIDTTGV